MLFFLVAMSSCKLAERDKQLRTYVRLQEIVDVVEAFSETEGRLPGSEELLQLVGAARMRDAWGRSLAFELFEADGQKHYVLASAGRDGQFERASLADYRLAEKRTVAYTPDLDLVAVDGRFVQSAGK